VRLRRSVQTEPGFTRRRHGRGFAYRDPAGLAVPDGRFGRVRFAGLSFATALLASDG
jgi:DNA topoisomerase IB